MEMNFLTRIKMQLVSTTQKFCTTCSGVSGYGGDGKLSGKIEFGHIWVGEDQRGEKTLINISIIIKALHIKAIFLWNQTVHITKLEVSRKVQLSLVRLLCRH